LELVAKRFFEQNFKSYDSYFSKNLSDSLLADKDDDSVYDERVPLHSRCSLVFFRFQQIVDKIEREELGRLSVFQIELEFLLELVWFDRVLKWNNFNFHFVEIFRASYLVRIDGARYMSPMSLSFS